MIEQRKDGVLRAALSQARREDLRDRVLIQGGRLAILLAFLASWQMASGTLVDRDFISSPKHVALALHELWTNGTLLVDGTQTIGEFVLGYFTGVVVGVTLSILLTWRIFVYRVAEPYLFVFYSLPKLALAPLIGLWFGLGATPKVVLAALVTSLLVIINLSTGVRSIKPEVVDLMRIMGANRLQTYRQLIIPFSAPYLLTALRFSIPFAMIAVILAEFLGSYQGLGHVIAEQAAYLNVDAMMALVVTLACFVAFFRLILLPLERWIAHHRL